MCISKYNPDNKKKRKEKPIKVYDLLFFLWRVYSDLSLDIVLNFDPDMN